MKRWVKQAVGTTCVALGLSGLWLVDRVQAGPDDPPAELAKKIAELDKNRDGRLQMSEFPFGAEVFEKADSDGDGNLTSAEILRYQRWEKFKNAMAKDKQYRAKFAQADRNQDGVIMRDEFPAADSVFVRLDRDGDGKVTYVEGLAFACEEEVAELFAELDKDLSGSLTKAEVPEEHQDGFILADVNGDGEATGQEVYDLVYGVRLEAAKASDQAGDKGESAAPPARPQTGSQPAAELPTDKLGVLGLLRDRFGQHDQDDDGRLVGAEFPGSAGLRSKLDVDRDGAVDRHELAVRLEFAKRLGDRGQELKAQIEQKGIGAELELLGGEIKALFLAGDYEAVQRLMDEVELRLRRS